MESRKNKNGKFQESLEDILILRMKILTSFNEIVPVFQVELSWGTQRPLWPAVDGARKKKAERNFPRLLYDGKLFPSRASTHTQHLELAAL
jgi:hypothetical protein